MTIPLCFENYETYASSLPVRFVHEDYRKLYTLNYLVREEDLKSTAERISEPPHAIVRGYVKYMAGPKGCGKTSLSSVLPAFLESSQLSTYKYEPGTHYLIYKYFVN